MPLACCIARFNQMQDPGFIFEEPRHSDNCRFCEDCGPNCPWPDPRVVPEKRAKRKKAS